jgi:hypothetical protein
VTASTETRVCRFCGEVLTPVPGGWIDSDGWDLCTDLDNQFHEPADPAYLSAVLAYLNQEKP